MFLDKLRLFRLDRKLHCKIGTFEKRKLFRIFRVQEKIHNSLTHAFTMKLYVPKYLRIVDFLSSIIQLCSPNIIYTLVNTNTVNTNFRLIRTLFVPLRALLIVKRPVNKKLRLSPGGRTDESMLYSEL